MSLMIGTDIYKRHQENFYLVVFAKCLYSSKRAADLQKLQKKKVDKVNDPCEDASLSSVTIIIQ